MPDDDQININGQANCTCPKCGAQYDNAKTAKDCCAGSR